MTHHFFRAFFAEIHKQHRIYFHGILIYFSMFIWPILEILTAYYMFKPFIADGANSDILKQTLGHDNIEMFLLIGYLGYNFFFSLVQSAWRFSFERFAGTLELIILTPSNRFAVILGNATSALIESMWLLTVFVAAIYFLLSTEWKIINVILLILGLLVMTIAAVSWGALLNSFFLLTRDAGLFYTILQEPLNFFGGVRFPISLFAPWMRAISYLLPLTYCLNILRKATLGGGNIQSVSLDLMALSVLVIIMLTTSYLILGLAEKRARRTGSLILF